MPDPISTEYRGHQPRNMAELRAWQKAVPREAALEPALPILDTHHHLWGKPGDDHFYTIEDYHRDLDAGHNILGSVYIEARQAGWRSDGPEEMRPVGEVERVLALAETHRHPHAEVAAAIVAFADLSIGDGIAKVLEAEIAASRGRMRGIRQGAGFPRGEIARNNPIRPREHLLMEEGFRRGLAHFERLHLSFDAWIIYDQIPELTDLADALPKVPFILNHLGGPIGAADYRPRQAEVRAEWRKGMTELAKRPNLSVKIGGLGMPMFGFNFENHPCPGSSRALQQAWQPLIDAALELFGTKRCMLESNFPPDMQSAGFNETWNAFKLATASLSRDERADLFYRTGATVYRLPGLLRRAEAAMPP